LEQVLAMEQNRQKYFLGYNLTAGKIGLPESSGWVTAATCQKQLVGFIN